MNRYAVIALLAALVCASSAAEAEQAAADTERAKELHALGLRHYSEGAMPAAIEAFRGAYSLVPAPGILFNLAQAYRQAGDCRLALDAYLSYLHRTPDQTTPEARSAVDRARAMNACLEAVSDQSASPIAPVEQSFGGPLRDRSDRPAGRTTRIAGLASVGIGVVLLGTGSVFALQARSNSNELDEFFAAGGQWTAEQARLERDGKRANRLAVGLTFAAGVAIAGGAVTYVLGLRSGAGTRVPIVVAPTPRGGSLVWSGSF